MKLKLRILQIDLARQKENLDYVKQYIDFAVECEYNALLIYLENAVRTESTPFFDKEDTYSIEEMQEIIAYAEKRGIDVIPAFENLGHIEKFTEYEEFSDIGEFAPKLRLGRFDNTVHCGCLTRPQFYQKMDKYIKEVMSIFKSPYVHMGLDEPFDFAICDECRARLKNGETKAQMFKDHILHCYELVKSAGKRMMMWDDFFEYADIIDQLPRDIIMCNWNYSFIQDQPGGHWVGKIRKDWFYYYDKLGFDYIFCVYSNRTSCTTNVDTFNDYAEKYSPIGALTTAWCRAESFYFGAYPFTKYCGLIWNGKLQTEEEKVKMYSEMLNCSPFVAKAILKQCGVGYDADPFSLVKIENDYPVKRAHRASLELLLEVLKTELKEPTDRASECYKDIYSVILSYYDEHRISEITRKVSIGKGKAYIPELLTIKSHYQETYDFYKELWAKYRKGIKSSGNQLDNKFLGKLSKIDDLIEKCNSFVPQGELYLEYMMQDVYHTARIQLDVAYEGEEGETKIYRGSIKPAIVSFDVGGIFTYKFPIKNKNIKYVKITVFGEGMIGIVHLRYVANGVKYVAKSVEYVEGLVKDKDNVSFEDTRYAILGSNDGIAHFNDIDLSRQLNVIKVDFKQL